MEHIKRHVFVCINQTPPNQPMGCCQSSGSIEIIQSLTEAVGMSVKEMMREMLFDCSKVVLERREVAVRR